MLSDCHTHLDRYSDEQVARLVERAAARGIERILVAGLDLASSRRAVDLAHRFPLLRACVGLHPLAVCGIVPDAEYRALATLADDPAVVAWSETGLDYRDGQAAPNAQRQAFERQLALTQSLGLPAIVHVVAALDDARAILQATGMAARSVVHYFQGDASEAEAWLALGAYISVGRPVTRPVMAALRAAVALVPLDRLLLETDTYPLPGRITEPADVAQVAQAVADLQGVSPAQVAAVTTANLERLLRRPILP